MNRRLAPGVSDVVFGIVLVSVLVGGRYRLLNDPGTTWHLRLGREILRTGSVPRSDTLTFTRAGQPWVDQSWLFDALLAAVVDRFGWPAAVAACGLGIAWVYATLARGLLRDGRSPLVVLVVAVLAAGVGATHFLVRPHLLTLAFVLVTLRVCQDHHARGSRGLFALPLLTALWANVHGGFLAGPFVVFTSALGHAIAGPMDRDRRRGVAEFLATGALCLLAALANPYGIELYRHVGRLLVSSGVTALIEEYQPIPFGKPDARVVEWVILALVGLPSVSSSRMTRYELAHALLWLHLALASVRHAPLFALAVAPGLARVLDGLPATPPSAPPTGDHRIPFTWPSAAALLVGALLACGAPIGGFDPSHWPLSALPLLNRCPAESRIFHEQDWGGLIASGSRPARRTYLDDRFELFGKEFILGYVNAIEGGPDWDEIRDRRSIGLVWVRPERGLARRLDGDPSWRVLHRDRVSVLYDRIPADASPGRVARSSLGTRP